MFDLDQKYTISRRSVIRKENPNLSRFSHGSGSPDRDPWDALGFDFKLLQNHVQKPYFGYSNPYPDSCLSRRIRIRG
uniref:Uncharacterized protein n=1 Tax=Romanomermis culicivorax TaxID=13658 RepID=A0A915HL33_ROMCU